MTVDGFMPLSQAIPAWPTDLIAQPAWLSEVGLRDCEMVDDGASQRLGVRGTLLWFREIAADLPLIPGFSMALLSGGGYTAVPFEADIRPAFALRVPNVSLAFRFQSGALRRVEQVDGRWAPKVDLQGQPVPVELLMNQVGVAADLDGNLKVTLPTGAPQINLGAVELGSTGIVLELNGIAPYFSASQPPPPGAAPGFRGVAIQSAKLHMPKDFDIPLLPSSYSAERMLIGSGGLSGTIRGTWQPTYNAATKTYQGSGAGRLFGIPCALRSLALSFHQSALVGSTIKAELLLPFFDTPVQVEISIGADGKLQVRLSKDDGLLTLRRENVFEIVLNGLGFRVHQGTFNVLLSGTLTPLFGGLEWPGFEVKELAIDSQGNVKLDGGWLNLRNQYSLKISGFSLEITKLGFGKSDDGGKWVGFSGALQLVDGITAGASVEGLRITWYDDGRSTRLSLNGVGVKFKVPGVLSFDGAVALRDLPEGRRFDGKVKILFECLDGLALDGQIVFGTHNGKRYYAIYLDCQLPAGIPLASTGLALYGMSGLFANQMGPNKPASQSWYDWYKQSPTGVTDLTSKWAYKQNGLAFGAGITIGTVSDNGYVFSGKVFFAIMFPGPIIMFEGKANMLKERAALSGGEEPMFRALGVLDFVENSLFFGLDAQYKFDKSSGALIDIRGGAEVFFDWDDYNWHLYLGQDEPREKRIRASIFKGIFQAESYFMIDNRQLRMGARVGWGKSWKFGPLGVTLEAWIEGNARLSWKPGHFHGDLWVHGAAGIKVFRFGLTLTVDARISADVFNPFHLMGEFEVGIKPPWPFKKRLKANVRLEWGPETRSPQVRLPLPLKEVAVEHLTVTTKWPLPRGQYLLPNYNDGGEDGYLRPGFAASGASVPDLATIPVVPLDARPHLTFSRPMHDDALVGVNVSSPTPALEVIGDPGANKGIARVRYGLKEVALEKYTGSSWTPLAWAPNSANDSTRLYGSWAPVPPIATGPDGSSNAASVGQTKLWLWSKTPFNYTLATGERWDDWFSRTYPEHPCPTLRPQYSVECKLETLTAFSRLDRAFVCQHHPFRWSWTRASARYQPHEGEQGIMFEPTSTEFAELTIHFGELSDGYTLYMFGGLGQTGDYILEEYRADGTLIPETVRILTTPPSGIATGSGVAQTAFIKLKFRKPIGLWWMIHVRYGPTMAEHLSRNQMETHINTQLAEWSRADNVLEPHSVYRVRVKTKLDVTGEGPLSGYNASPEQTEYAYFRTAGPPGLTSLSRPLGLPAGQAFVSGLDDLGGYVSETLPRSQGADGKPLLTRPVYRAYDVGVDFNVNYVDQMYRMARRDLLLYLYDNNNRPIRDAQGRIVVMHSSWGQADTLSLTKAEELWEQTVSANSCFTLPATFSQRSAKQGLKNKAAYVLDAERLYEARLVPLLLREEFGGVASGTVAAGPSGTLGAWRVVDKGVTAGPGRWQTGSAGTPAAFYITQTSAIAEGGTLLTYAGDSTLPAADLPGTWTNYRASVYLRLAVAGGEIGLAVRYKDSNNYYCYAISQTTRRLLKVVAGVTTVLTSQTLTTAHALNKDYLASVEVENGRLRVYQDGEPIFDVADASVAQGGVALVCASHAGARFTGVRVDDLRPRAPIVFRFPFTTSRFVNFFHHLHSYTGQPWSQALAAEAPLTTALAAAVAPAPVAGEVPLAESQAYQALAEAALGVAAERQQIGSLEVTRLTYNNVLRALLVRSPEPIDWRRTDLAFARTTVTGLARPSVPGAAKLAAASFGSQSIQESVTLLLQAPLSLAGWKIEYRPAIRTTSADDAWRSYYTFGAEASQSDGVRVRVYSGSQSAAPTAEPGLVQRFVGSAGALFPAAGVELRLVGPDGVVAHSHPFLPGSSYSAAAVKILRKADGTGFALLASPFPAGPQRLTLTFRRGDGAPKLSEAGNSGPEQVALDII